VKALVTGAAGFIGSTLATALTSDGIDVVGLDCFTDYYARSIKEDNLAELRRRKNFSFIEAELGTADLSAALDGVTHVYHLAAQAGVRKSWGADFKAYTTLNIDATQRLLEALKDRRIHRLVYASSSSVYGDGLPMPLREDQVLAPLSPYGVTKLAAEHLCHLYFASFGVPAVSLRFFTVYGPRQRPDMGFHRFIKAALTGQPIALYGDGGQTRDFTYIDDIVQACRAAGDQGRPGAVYNIGGGSRVSITEVLDLIGRITKRTLDIHREPPQKGDMRDTSADTSRARADLGFKPTATLESGLTAESAWLSRVLGMARG